MSWDQSLSGFLFALLVCLLMAGPVVWTVRRLERLEEWWRDWRENRVKAHQQSLYESHNLRIVAHKRWTGK